MIEFIFAFCKAFIIAFCLGFTIFMLSYLIVTYILCIKNKGDEFENRWK